MDFKRAQENLEKALLIIPQFEPERLSENQKSQIKAVITGSHLTFRYILITALLAKVTDPAVHMRSIQARSSLDGAYDARSLCHQIWVPFEQTRLNSKLGGSNEPYLNKPARFPEIDKSNPVRGGNDRMILNTLYDLLEDLNSARTDVHTEAFLFSMKLISARSEGLIHEIILPPVKISQPRLMDFVDRFLSTCNGGECAASTTGALFRVIYPRLKVIVHPANQAGTSSNEIGDVDIKTKDSFFMAIEVKDKVFSESDINHAIRKVVESGNSRLLFLIGRHGKPETSTINFAKISDDKAKCGVDLSFEGLDNLCMRMLSIFSEEQRKEFIKNIAVILDEMRATDLTKNHFKSCVAAL